jgi:hypothetical protein
MTEAELLAAFKDYLLRWVLVPRRADPVMIAAGEQWLATMTGFPTIEGRCDLARELYIVMVDAAPAPKMPDPPAGFSQARRRYSAAEIARMRGAIAYATPMTFAEGAAERFNADLDRQVRTHIFNGTDPEDLVQWAKQVVKDNPGAAWPQPFSRDADNAV